MDPLYVFVTLWPWTLGDDSTVAHVRHGSRGSFIDLKAVHGSLGTGHIAQDTLGYFYMHWSSHDMPCPRFLSAPLIHSFGGILHLI
jgi:hypothetical protein